MRKVFLGLAVLLILDSQSTAGPAEAVVRIQSHGGSGTVIWTRPGRTYVLSAAHMFMKREKWDRVVIHVPCPTPGPEVKSHPRCIAIDPGPDLALVVMDTGPLPYVCPVQSPGVVAVSLLSVGYDELKWPAVQRPTRFLQQGTGFQVFTHACVGELEYTGRGQSDDLAITEALPWHGRSGGALIDQQTGCLVGVVSGYRGTLPQTWAERKPGACGIYASHPAVLRFLQRYAPEVLAQEVPQQYEQPQLGVPIPYAAPYAPPALIMQRMQRPGGCPT